MFRVNGQTIVQPIGLNLVRQDNFISSLQTQTGRVIGDIRGWRYADTTLKWGVLPESQLLFLLSLNNFTITFDGIDGTETTVNALRLSFGGTRQRFLKDGKPFYSDIEMGVKFPNVYSE